MFLAASSNLTRCFLFIYVIGLSSLSIYSLNLFRKGGQRICLMVSVSISVGVTAVTVMSICDSEKRTPTPLGLKFGIAVINRSIRRLYGRSENMVILFSPCCEIEKAIRSHKNRMAIDSITYSVVEPLSVQRSAARLRGEGYASVSFSWSLSNCRSCS